MKILILNGPNLNLVGVREPGIYGSRTLDSFFEEELTPLLEALPGEVEGVYFQSNSEGMIIDRLQQAAYGDEEERVDGIILNAGAYTHYSLGIADAIRSIDVPVVEVHISNIYAREEVRHHSVISPVCSGVIAGLGLDVYKLAAMWLAEHAGR